MSRHLCEQCGAANAADAQFCAQCDFYLGWDTGSGTLGGSPLSTGAVPLHRESHTERISMQRQPLVRPRIQPAVPPTPARKGGAATAPEADLVEPEVRVDPVEGGRFEIRIHNTSSIVDGYTVVAPDAPPWLSLSHDEIRLLTDEESVCTITAAVNPGYLVNVQRFVQRVQVCSVEDPGKRTGVDLVVVVLRTGGPATISAEPPMIRLRDRTEGRFSVRLDNRGANYPQRYRLYGRDSEGVVRFSFEVPVVEIPARRDHLVRATFRAPAPEPGQQLNRTLTITVASDEGAFDSIITVIQQTSAPPQDYPVQIRLEPSVIRVVDQTTAEMAAIVDNRRGARDRRLRFAGRDREGRVRVDFAHRELLVRAGEQARVGVYLTAKLPGSGEEIDHLLSVVCHDGTEEREATGNFVQAASAAAITTASIRLEPEHVVVRNTRKGRFRVTVDNRRGASPLSVRLAARNPENAVSFTITPAHLNVAPRSSGYATVAVQANLPDAGTSVDRDITVSATAGSGDALEAKGVFSQSMSEILPLLRLCLTLLGGLFVALGVFKPWFVNGPNYYPDKLLEVKDAVGWVDSDRKWIAVTHPTAGTVMLILAGVMMLGILSVRGRITVTSGILIAVLTVGYTIFAQTNWNTGTLAYGGYAVILGAVMGVVGGFCVRR